MFTVKVKSFVPRFAFIPREKEKEQKEIGSLCKLIGFDERWDILSADQVEIEPVTRVDTKEDLLHYHQVFNGLEFSVSGRDIINTPLAEVWKFKVPYQYQKIILFYRDHPSINVLFDGECYVENAVGKTVQKLSIVSCIGRAEFEAGLKDKDW